MDLKDADQVLERVRSVDWSFTDDDTDYLAHDLHPYPAKFIPQIPRNLINALSLRGDCVWDPFGGSGTTALEALLMGRRAVSTDLNPLATLITQAKCTSLAPEQRAELGALRDRLHDQAQAGDVEGALSRMLARTSRYVPSIPNLEDWFLPCVVHELAYALHEIDRLSDKESQVFARVVLSSVVVSVSNQDEETRYARRDKEIPPGKTLASFARALDEALRKHEPLERLLGYRRVHAATVNVTQDVELDAHIPPSSVDLVVTSPPYANATDYHLYHRFRLFWLGFDPRRVGDAEIGSHLRHQRTRRGFELYEVEMRVALANVARALRPGRYAALIVGDSVFSGETIRTAERLLNIGPDVGLEPIGSVSRPVHQTRRSFIAAARRTRSEDIVLLRARAVPVRVHLLPPPYKTWPYEDVLRTREAQRVLGVNVSKIGGTLTAKLDCYAMDRVQRLTFTHEVRQVIGPGKWRTWQATLENGDATAQRKDPKYLAHGIHAYKGKFYPQLAKALLNLASIDPGQIVLDPFCGSGTVLLEAQLNGMRPVGMDLHPLAVLISKAKTAILRENPVVLDRIVKSFGDRLQSNGSTKRDRNHFSAHLLEEIERWFPENVIRKLGWILDGIEAIPNLGARCVLQVLVSSVIREVSQQDPADLRIRRRKEPLEDAPVVELVLERIREFRRRLHHFEHRRAAAPVDFLEALVLQDDARSATGLAGWDGKVDCVVTSPPYATALPYIDTDRLSLLTILGIESRTRGDLEQRLTGSREIRDAERRALEEQINRRDIDEAVGSTTALSIVREVFRRNSRGQVGFRRRNMASLLLRYFMDMRAVMGRLDQLIRRDGNLFFVIGDNRTEAGGEDVRIASTRALAEMGANCGWTLVETIPITVTREALVHSKNSITENAVLWFRASVARASRGRSAKKPLG